MNKRLPIAIAVVIFCGLIFLTGTLVWNRMTDYSSVLEANWDFALPKDARYTEVYEAHAESGWMGDGVRYHVFSYESEEPMMRLLADGHLLPAESSTPADVLLDELSVPAEERPAYDACTIRYRKEADNDTLYLLLDRERNRLYIVESFY